jgi:hypothetical protein
MTLSTRFEWEVAAEVTAIACLSAIGLWLLLRKRPKAEELERRRRDFLVQSGRLVDGMLLDLYNVDGEDGRELTLLLFHYRIGGVDYECSQDTTYLTDVVDPQRIRLGFPCSVRAGLPSLPDYEDPEPNDISHLRQGRG